MRSKKRPLSCFFSGEKGSESEIQKLTHQAGIEKPASTCIILNHSCKVSVSKSSNGFFPIRGILTIIVTKVRGYVIHVYLNVVVIRSF